VTRTPVAADARPGYLRVVEAQHPLVEGGEGYVGVLFANEHTGELAANYVTKYGETSFLCDGYVAVVDLATGFTRVLYRPESFHNTLFVTDRCNSNCLMCSQPPKEVDDSGAAEELIRLIDLIDVAPRRMGITGGEPTLLGDGLARVLNRLKTRFPETPVTMLSNARLFADEQLTRSLAAVAPPLLLTYVPLYANNAFDHDYVVQAKGAFDQTVTGLHHAAKHGLAVEIRVVLHKQTIPGLLALVEYVYRNLPFVQNVNLMGMENMGYVKKNWDLLWIDPLDYQSELEAAVRYLHQRRIGVSLYNLPLCVLPKSLWGVARQSISDFKNIYLPICGTCRVRSHCAGLFASSENRHSRGIRAIA
jgi:His-Xaa-Ser system radical SAM maturase HxsC